MSTDETTFWQGQAALLDPLAYVLKVGTSQTHTVGTGETDYLVGGWYLQATGGGTSFFHRQADFRDALPLSDGTVITTDGSNAGSYAYICKPSLVTGSDARYTSDPRALFFDRYMAIGQLTHYAIGATDSIGGNNVVTATFPNDFTYGLIIHASQHDVSWVGLEHTGADFTMAVLNEIGDNDALRLAESCVFPFTRTVFPKFKLRGGSDGDDQGRGTIRYLKLTGGW